MGGGKKGGGTTSTTTTAQPWSGVKPYLLEGYKDLSGIYGEGAPQYYGGSTVAPMSGYTSAAINAQAMRGAMGSPLTAAAQGQLTDTMAGKYLDAGNPYMQGAMNSAIRPIEQNYQTNILPGVDSSFASAGRYGSGAHTDMMGQAYEAMGRNIGDVSSNMAFQNYNAERQRQNEGMLYAPQLAQQDYFDINQLGTSGSALDAYNQALINADIERYNYGQNADWLRTQDFITSLQAQPQGSSSQTTGPRPNAFTSALGTGTSLLGLGSMLGLFSDERLKENIEPVGMLNNGLPVYQYNYKWGGPTQIGVMAQDAAIAKPEAVGVSDDGFLLVDYSKVTE